MRLGRAVLLWLILFEDDRFGQRIAGNRCNRVFSRFKGRLLFFLMHLLADLVR